MAHKVKCYYCGITFDRDKEPSEKVGARRYAHLKCYTDNEGQLREEDMDKKLLYDYLQKILGQDYNAAKVSKQINEFVEDKHYSYSGIYKTLYYFYDIKGGKREEAMGGIGIVPFVWDEAYKYYLGIHNANKINKDKDIEKIKNLTETIEIFSPKAERKIKLFNMEEE